jgi:HEAT repeat protein
MKKILCTSLNIALLSLATAWAQTDPFAELPAYDFGKDSKPLAAIEKQIREGGKAAYPQIEARLLAAVQKPGATYACKKFVADTLRAIGSEACVAPMAKLLNDEKTADLGRLALEGLPGKSVDAALLKALKRAKGKVQIGLIQSLGARRSEELVGLAGGHIASGNADLARAALQALARVGTVKAADAIKAAQVPADLKPLSERTLADCGFMILKDGDKAKAYAIFDELYNKGTSVPAVIAGLNGLVDARGAEAQPIVIAALKDKREPVALAAAQASARLPDKDIAQQVSAKLPDSLKGVLDKVVKSAQASGKLPGKTVSKELSAALPGLSPAIQVAVIRALAERGDKSALPAVKTAMASQDEAVKTEAILALENVGDQTVVNDLLALSVGSGPVASAAQQTLGRIRAKGVDEALTKLLDDADPQKVRVAVGALKARGVKSVVPKLLKMAESDKAEIRNAAYEGLDGFAGPAELPALMDLLRKKAGTGDAGRLVKVMWSATKPLGKEDERFAKLWADAGSDDAVKTAILPTAREAAGADALKVVTQTLASGSDSLKEVAARTLFEWPNDRAVNPIVNVIKTTGNTKHKILAARGLVRILNDRKTGLSTKRKVEVLEQVLPLMERPEDKKMIEDAMAKAGKKPAKAGGKKAGK